MRRTRGRTLRAGVALSALAIVLTACGGSDSSTPTGDSSGDAESESSAPAGDSTLVVWADNSANTAKAIEPLCQQWAEANGVTCTVKKFNGGGELRRPSSAATRPATCRTSTRVRTTRSAPSSTTASLLRSTSARERGQLRQGGGRCDAAPRQLLWRALGGGEHRDVHQQGALARCPATLDDAVSNAKALISAGKATEGLGIAMQIGETGDFYHWYPLFTADGGYAFARNADGSQPRRHWAWTHRVASRPPRRSRS